MSEKLPQTAKTPIQAPQNISPELQQKIDLAKKEQLEEQLPYNQMQESVENPDLSSFDQEFEELNNAVAALQTSFEALPANPEDTAEASPEAKKEVQTPTPEEIEKFWTDPELSKEEIEKLNPKPAIPQKENTSLLSRAGAAVLGGVAAGMMAISPPSADAQFRIRVDVDPNGQVRGGIRTPQGDIRLGEDNRRYGNPYDKWQNRNFDNQYNNDYYKESYQATGNSMQRDIDEHRRIVQTFERDLRRVGFNDIARENLQIITSNTETLVRKFENTKRNVLADTVLTNSQKRSIIQNVNNAIRLVLDVQRKAESMVRGYNTRGGYNGSFNGGFGFGRNFNN